MNNVNYHEENSPSPRLIVKWKIGIILSSEGLKWLFLQGCTLSKII